MSGVTTAKSYIPMVSGISATLKRERPMGQGHICEVTELKAAQNKVRALEAIVAEQREQIEGLIDPTYGNVSIQTVSGLEAKKRLDNRLRELANSDEALLDAVMLTMVEYGDRCKQCAVTSRFRGFEALAYRQDALSEVCKAVNEVVQDAWHLYAESQETVEQAKLRKKNRKALHMASVAQRKLRKKRRKVARKARKERKRQEVEKKVDNAD